MVLPGGEIKALWEGSRQSVRRRALDQRVRNIITQPLRRPLNPQLGDDNYHYCRRPWEAGIRRLHLGHCGMLVGQISRQFTLLMNWDNWKDYWIISHKIPLRTFQYNSRKDPDFLAAWALSNLRPPEPNCNTPSLPAIHPDIPPDEERGEVSGEDKEIWESGHGSLINPYS